MSKNSAPSEPAQARGRRRRLLRAASAFVAATAAAVGTSIPLASASASAATAIVRHVNRPAVRVTCDLKERKLSSAGHFRIYACDKAGDNLVDHAATELEALWPKMTVKQPDGMGPPEGWANGNKGEPLLVYLMPPSTNACLDATSCSDPVNLGTDFGQESPTTFGGKPDFILLFNEKMPSGSLDATLCHEFFHSLEDTVAPGDAAGSWLGEASATWAETIYVPKSSDAAAFFPSFQQQKTSLNSTANTHQYGAFVWLLWVTQDIADDPTGDLGVNAVFGLWQEIGKAHAKTGAEVDAVINRLYPWKRDFARFALEDLNEQRFKPDVTPYLFHDAYQAVSDSFPPRPLKTVPVVSGPSDFPVDLPPLSSWSRNFSPIAPGIKDVYFDFTNLSKNAEAYVLAKIDNKYQVFDDTGNDQNFCLDDPKENATEFTVVIVNHSPGESVSNGNYTLDAASKCATPVPCQKLLHSSDMPYDVLSAIVVPLDDFGIALKVCEFLGEDSQTNPLVTAGLAAGMPSVTIAKQGMKDDRRLFPQLTPVQHLGDEALTGCATQTSCSIVITIARVKQVLVIADTNTSEVNTIALVRTMIARLPAAMK